MITYGLYPQSAEDSSFLESMMLRSSCHITCFVWIFQFVMKCFELCFGLGIFSFRVLVGWFLVEGGCLFVVFFFLRQLKFLISSFLILNSDVKIVPIRCCIFLL